MNAKLINSVLFLTLPLSLVACLGGGGGGGGGGSSDGNGSSVGVINTSNAIEYNKLFQSLEDERTKVKYYPASERDDNLDAVQIYAEDDRGFRVPISFMGNRVEALGGKVTPSNICQFLGFTAPEKTTNADNGDYQAYRYVNTATFSPNKNDREKKVNGDLAYAMFPVFHWKPSGPVDSIFWPNVTTIDSYFYDDDSYHNYPMGYYTRSITCVGTSQIHWNNEGKFDEANFFDNVLKGKMAEEINMKPEIHYKESQHFLVAKGEDFWTTVSSTYYRYEEVKFGNNGNNLDTLYEWYVPWSKIDNAGNVIKPKRDDDKLMLQHAQAGAEDICRKSGYSVTVGYTFKFLVAENEKTYYFDKDNDVWTTDMAPDNAKTTVGNRELELPNLYLDVIYCSN